jgi:hypothetical protein
VIANLNAMGFYERLGFEHTGRASTGSDSTWRTLAQPRRATDALMVRA